MGIKSYQKIKGIILDNTTISFLEKEAAKQKRSFSAQAALILEEWVKEKSKLPHKEDGTPKDILHEITNELPRA